MAAFWTGSVQSAQRWLNAKVIATNWTFVWPTFGCSGRYHYARCVQRVACPTPTDHLSSRLASSKDIIISLTFAGNGAFAMDGESLRACVVGRRHSPALANQIRRYAAPATQPSQPIQNTARTTGSLSMIFQPNPLASTLAVTVRKQSVVNADIR